MNQPSVAAPDIASVHRDAPLQRLYGRIAWRILPFMLLCYVLAYLDRVNISFAKLQMQRDLGMSDAAYGLGAGVFFLGYMLLEIPSNLLLEKIGARKTISRIMILWGMTSASMMFVHDGPSFYLLRFLLGTFEAGFAPGMILYLTFWFSDARRASVMAIVLMAGPIAGMLGGPLSAGIMTVFQGTHGLAGWQWLFLAEGLPCVLLGAVALCYLDDSPSNARWLTDTEKALLLAETKASSAQSRHAALSTALKDPRVYAMAFSYFCLVCGLYTVSFWLPTLLRAAGVASTSELGWYAALPYLATLIAVPLLAGHSDRLRERRLHSAIPALAGALGLLLASTLSPRLGGLLLCMALVTICIYAAYVVFWSIPTAYLRGPAAAGGIAFINSIGLLGGFVSPSLIGWLKAETGTLQSGLMAMALILCAGGASILLNRIPAAGTRAKDELRISEGTV
ncbi:MFS transporter [Ralstonia sp. 22086]|uniref:MFS transporter n=1 Tax=Ralstonia sp. 22086 TaxID=3453870 RepID=UPI003F85001A